MPTTRLNFNIKTALDAAPRRLQFQTPLREEEASLIESCAYNTHGQRQPRQLWTQREPGDSVATCARLPKMDIARLGLRSATSPMGLGGRGGYQPLNIATVLSGQSGDDSENESGGVRLPEAGCGHLCGTRLRSRCGCCLCFAACVLLVMGVFGAVRWWDAHHDSETSFASFSSRSKPQPQPQPQPQPRLQLQLRPPPPPPRYGRTWTQRVEAVKSAAPKPSKPPKPTRPPKEEPWPPPPPSPEPPLPPGEPPPPTPSSSPSPPSPEPPSLPLVAALSDPTRVTVVSSANANASANASYNPWRDMPTVDPALVTPHATPPPLTQTLASVIGVAPSEVVVANPGNTTRTRRV